MVRKYYLPYLLILPSFILITFIIAYPMANLFYLSLFFKNLVVPQRTHFVGLQNYTKVLFETPEFWIYFKHTLIYTIPSILGSVFLGMGVALLLNEKIKFRSVYRTAVLLPWMIPLALTAMFFRVMLQPKYGLINALLKELGMISESIPFLGESHWAMFSIIIADIWAWTPFMIILLLGGLQIIPEELYDAAEVDGAGYWHRFQYVTIPHLRPIAFMAILIRSIFIVRSLDIVYVLTRGGPGKATEVWATYLYDMGVNWLDMGMGATLGILLLIFTVLIVFVLMTIMKPRKYTL